VIEFLQAKYKNVTPCKSQYHSDFFFSRKDERVSDTTQPKLLASVFTLLALGRCSECIDSNDLAPDL
jgi:hypothetical protein